MFSMIVAIKTNKITYLLTFHIDNTKVMPFRYNNCSSLVSRYKHFFLHSVPNQCYSFFLCFPQLID